MNMTHDSINSSMSLLMAAIGPGEDDNGQSILDDHVSRIWRDNSSGQTPSRSPPGRHSPDRPATAVFPGLGGRSHIAGPSPNVSGVLHSSFTGVLNKSMGVVGSSSSSGHHKRSKDSANASASAGHLLASLQSFDSGMGEDRSMLLGDGAGSSGGQGDTHHKHIHHYHHHHHHISKDKMRHLEHEVNKRGPGHMVSAPVLASFPYVETQGNQRSKEGSKRTGGKRASDANSNIDSGIYDLPPAVPNLRDPANEKYVFFYRFFNCSFNDQNL